MFWVILFSLFVSPLEVLPSIPFFLVTFGIAFSVTALVGTKFLGRRRGIQSATVLVIIAFSIVFLGLFFPTKPWPEAPAGYRTVRCSYSVGTTADIENLTLVLPYPVLDEQALGIQRVYWDLTYTTYQFDPQTGEISSASEQVEVKDGKVVQLVGDRTKTPEVSYELVDSKFGTKGIKFKIDKMYADEGADESLFFIFDFFVPENQIVLREASFTNGFKLSKAKVSWLENVQHLYVYVSSEKAHFEISLFAVDPTQDLDGVLAFSRFWESDAGWYDLTLGRPGVEYLGNEFED